MRHALCRTPACELTRAGWALQTHHGARCARQRGGVVPKGVPAEATAAGDNAKFAEGGDVLVRPACRTSALMTSLMKSHLAEFCVRRSCDDPALLRGCHIQCFSTVHRSIDRVRTSAEGPRRPSCLRRRWWRLQCWQPCLDSFSSSPQPLASTSTARTCFRCPSLLRHFGVANVRAGEQ